MSANLSGPQIVKVDEGGANARIIARVEKTDFRRIEAASLKIRARIASAEGKRLFVRYFSSLQLHAHFISVIAPLRLDATEVEKVESAIRARLDGAAQSLNDALDGAEALFQAHGITTAASYDTQALEIDVPVISSLGRRYLEVIGKLDQLMPLLQTLEIHEVVTSKAIDIQRSLLKRQVREVAQAARNLASGLRRRMNTLARESAAVGDADKAGGRAGSPENDPPGDGMLQDETTEAAMDGESALAAMTEDGAETPGLENEKDVIP